MVFHQRPLRRTSLIFASKSKRILAINVRRVADKSRNKQVLDYDRSWGGKIKNNWLARCIEQDLGMCAPERNILDSH